jgi:hypothetical protein
MHWMGGDNDKKWDVINFLNPAVSTWTNTQETPRGEKSNPSKHFTKHRFIPVKSYFKFRIK